MTHAQQSLSRRRFIQAGLAVGGGLLIHVRIPELRADPVGPLPAVPEAYIRIGGDGRVTLTMPFVEMGQGTYTAIPMLVAEELEIDLDQVRLEHAPPNDMVYGNPLLAGVQATGGSTSVRAAWQPLREAGATARMMLIAAAAQRWQVDATSCRAERGAVLHADSGRRLGYGALAAEAARIPVPQNIALKPPVEFRLIGRPTRRLDTPGKVNGTATFGIDARPRGVRIAAIAQSPVFGGRVKSLDEAAAKAVKGVRQVVRLADAVAVVADHMGAAKKGQDALNLEWEPGANATLSSADIAAELEQAVRSPGAIAQDTGDVGPALARAVTKVEAHYAVPFLAHATMEPMNCSVHVRPDGCEMWVGTQVIARAQAEAAEVTGLPLDKVTVHNHFIGGGFGRRLEVDGVRRAVQVARQVDGPVKVIWTREEDIQHDMYRPTFRDRLTAGLDAAGRPVAWDHRFAGSSIIARWLPQAFSNGLDPDTTDGAINLLYDLPNVHVEYCRVEPQGVPTAFWRSVGPSHNVFVIESFIDELATAARQDPVAYRSALLGKAPRAKAVLLLAAEKAGWGTSLPQGVGRGVSLQSVFATYLAVVAEVAVAKDGTVRVQRIVCAVDCGTVVNPDTVEAQIQGGVIFGLTAALYGEITIKEGRVEQANFDSYPALRMNEVPEIEVHIVQNTEPPGGIGEPGTSAIAPAIANAVFAATGRRLRKLPIDSSALKQPA